MSIFVFEKSHQLLNCMEKEMATHSSILPGESHRQRSLAGYSPQSSDSDMTKLVTHTHLTVMGMKEHTSYGTSVDILDMLWFQLAVEKDSYLFSCQDPHKILISLRTETKSEFSPLDPQNPHSKKLHTCSVNTCGINKWMINKLTLKG